MQQWFLLSFATLVLWGLWGFFAKVAAGAGPNPFPSAPAWQLAGELLVLLGVLTFVGFRVDVTPGVIMSSMAAGAALFLGLLTFILALSAGGKASIVVPMSGLYPIVTLGLGVLLLKEQPSVSQAFGVLAALVAIVLLSR